MRKVDGQASPNYDLVSWTGMCLLAPTSPACKWDLTPETIDG